MSFPTTPVLSLAVATSALLGSVAVAQVAAPDFNGDGRSDLAIGVPAEDVGAAADAGAVSVIYGSAAGLNSAGNQFWTQDSASIRDTAELGDLFGAALAWGDFNNDGFTDLAVGVPGEDVGAVVNAGAVSILYGSAAGLTAAGNKIFHQNISGVLDAAETDDDFGYSLAAGDFNGDGYVDLAVGARGEDIGAITAAGAVAILYGSANGLRSAGNQFWSQNSPGILDVAEAGDNFGFALAAGDFNNDGFDDLAVGVQDEDVGAILDAGAVNVLLGSATGLSGTGDQFWTQDKTGIADSCAAGDNFGFALAAGDFNGDGRTDLAVGVPEEDVNGTVDAGAVNVLYGSANGLKSGGNQFWTQDSAGILNAATLHDFFGHDLAAGDFDNDGRDDLAVGVRDDDVGLFDNAGAVAVIFGGATGLDSAGNQFWTMGADGLPGSPGTGDNFGDGLCVGDFDGDGFYDLAAAAHDDEVAAITDAGSVVTIYGSASGLAGAGSQLWTQDSPGILDACELGDQFGMGMPQ